MFKPLEKILDISSFLHLYLFVNSLTNDRFIDSFINDERKEIILLSGKMHTHMIKRTETLPLLLCTFSHYI